MKYVGILIACLAGCLSANCTPQLSRSSADSSASRTSREGPDKLLPVEMAQHVEQLARAGRLDEARVWWFRGATRSMIIDSLAQVYAVENFNRGVTPHILRLEELDSSAMEELQLAAVDWERSAPLELPEGFPRDRLDQLPALREKLAAFVSDGLSANTVRRAELQEIRDRIEAGQPPEEAVALIPPDRRSQIVFLDATYVGCEHGLEFAAWRGGASSNEDGSRAALGGCNELKIVDLPGGKVDQRLDELRYDPTVLTTVSVSGRLRIVSHLGGASAPSGPGLYATSAETQLEPINVGLSEAVVADNAKITSSAASADGRFVVVEWCSDKQCQIFTAIDLKSSRLIWQTVGSAGARNRLIASVVQTGGQPVALFEMRQPDGSRKTELVNLETGGVSVSDKGTIELAADLAETPACTLLEKPDGDALDRYGRGIRWPDGRPSALLRDPDRTPVSDCTVSPDGQRLLVIVAPFVYRFEIR